MKASGGHGDPRKKRGKRPDPAQGFAPIHDKQSDGDEKDEEYRIPEFRSARSAAEVHIVLEIASNRLAETHGLRPAAEAVGPNQRFSEDEEHGTPNRIKTINQ
ncbi:UNVERIFIED_ORG: hypothetical protein GGE63_003330 [Rhizobium esperanzae]